MKRDGRVECVSRRSRCSNPVRECPLPLVRSADSIEVDWKNPWHSRAVSNIFLARMERTKKPRFAHGLRDRKYAMQHVLVWWSHCVRCASLRHSHVSSPLFVLTGITVTVCEWSRSALHACARFCALKILMRMLVATLQDRGRRNNS